LFAVFVDDADFACTNSIVDADKGLCRTFVECDGAPPKVAYARIRGLPESPRAHGRTLSIASAWLLWMIASTQKSASGLERAIRIHPGHVHTDQPVWLDDAFQLDRQEVPRHGCCQSPARQRL